MADPSPSFSSSRFSPIPVIVGWKGTSNFCWFSREILRCPTAAGALSAWSSPEDDAAGAGAGEGGTKGPLAVSDGPCGLSLMRHITAAPSPMPSSSSRSESHTRRRPACTRVMGPSRRSASVARSSDTRLSAGSSTVWVTVLPSSSCLTSSRTRRDGGTAGGGEEAGLPEVASEPPGHVGAPPTENDDAVEKRESEKGLLAWSAI
mmetsp:Transcript_48831/g.121126  ORF Transcript_48831/g.121126 Transcript_48831/m.121126 type:complete len:205 (-) Transcript_48831:37-651(-)